ncbi:MAG: DUF4412 domain-containing protein, partial [Candidatus Kapaibacterium sp.]
PNRFPILFILASFVLSSCSDRASMPGKAFEGKIVQQISVDASGMAPKMENHDTTYTAPSPALKQGMGIGLNSTITMYVKGDKVACNMSVLGGFISFKTIIDRNNRTITFLSPNKHAYVTNLRSIDKIKSTVDDSLNAHTDLLDSLDQMLPKPTGSKQTINGLECEEYKGTFKGMDMDMWITQDPRLKFYDVIRDAFLGRSRTGEGGMEEIMALLKPIAGEGKVPAKMTLMKDGKPFIKTELKELSEEKVDDSVFEIPKDYEVVKADDEKK